MVDWYYIFSILELGVYPPPKAIYNVHKIIRFYFPGETFCVLKEKKEREYGEYRTRRLILEALENIESIHKASGVRCGTWRGGISPTPEVDVFHP